MELIEKYALFGGDQKCIEELCNKKKCLFDFKTLSQEGKIKQPLHFLFLFSIIFGESEAKN